MNRIMHAKINGRATVNLKIYQIIVLIIGLKKAKGKKTEKKNEKQRLRKKLNEYL